MTDADGFVVATEAHMRAAIARTPIAAPAAYLLNAGGKRLRARLVWWAAAACGGPRTERARERLIQAGAAIELAHLGSLVHDDIVDGADTRRGVATLHRTHGVLAAVDAGAAIAHLANEIAAGLGQRARRSVRRALLATCRGQIRELALSFVLVSPRTRLAVMQEKTGAFFQLAADLGAGLGGGTVRSRAAIGRFARRFGVAFQIADDVLDLAGDPTDLGRANGSDLREGVLTLPVLLADDSEGRLPPLLERIRRTRDAHAVATCTSFLDRSGGIVAARAVASWWLARALDALRDLPGRPACACLADLARSSVQRGLRAGRPTFADDTRVAAATPPAIAFTATTMPRLGTFDPALPSPLAHVLEWFHPGLATMVAARAATATAHERRRRFGERLQQHRWWSPNAALAADAIALAHALSDERGLTADPVRALAAIDALHCAAIGFLALAPTASEHREMAARARRLMERQQPNPSLRAFARPLEPSTMHFSA